MNSNKKSDIKAKAAYVEHLKSNGYSNPKVIASPADITAEKNGNTWYFERVYDFPAEVNINSKFVCTYSNSIIIVLPQVEYNAPKSKPSPTLIRPRIL